MDPSRRGHAILQWTAITALMTAMAVAYTWPLATVLGRAVPGDQRDPLLVAALLDHVMGSLARLRWQGMWQTPFFAGQPNSLAFSDTLLGTAWYGVPLWWATPDPVVRVNLFHMAGLVFSGLGAAVLGTLVTGHRGAGVVCGVVYGFSPFQLIHNHHAQMHQGWAAPLAFAGLWWVAWGTRKPGAGWVVAASALALQILSSSYVGMYAGAVALPAVLLLLVGRGLHGLRRDAAWLAAGAAVATLLLGPSMRHYVAVQEDLGFERRIEEVRGFSVTAASLRMPPDGLRHPPHGAPRPPHPEASTWPGRTAPFLTLLGVVLLAYRQRRRARAAPGLVDPHGRAQAITAAVAVALAAWSVWLSWGPGPTAGLDVRFAYSWFLHAMPGFSSLRVPARFHALTLLMLAVGAALAVRQLARLNASLATPIYVAAALACAVDVWPNPLRLHPLPDGGDMGPVLANVASQAPPGPIVELPYRLYWRAAQNDLNTTRHHRPTFNGYSGVEPPLSLALRYLLPSFPLSGAPDVVRQLGATALVLHRGPPRADPGERMPFLEEVLAGAAPVPPGFAVRMNVTHGAWLEVSPQANAPLISLTEVWSSQVRACGSDSAGARTLRVDLPLEHTRVAAITRHAVTVEGARALGRLELPALGMDGLWVGALAVEGAGPVRVMPRGGGPPLEVRTASASGPLVGVTVRAALPATLREAQSLWFRVEVETRGGVLAANEHEVRLQLLGVPGQIRPTALPLRTDAVPGCPGVAEYVLEFLHGRGAAALQIDVVRRTNGARVAQAVLPVTLVP